MANIDQVEHKYSNTILEAKFFVILVSCLVVILVIVIVFTGLESVTSEFNWDFLYTILGFWVGYEFIPWLSWKLAGGYKVTEVLK